MIVTLKCFGHAAFFSWFIFITLSGKGSSATPTINVITAYCTPRLTFCGISCVFFCICHCPFFRFCCLRKLHKYATKCNQCIIVKRVVLYIAAHTVGTSPSIWNVAHHVANSFGLSIFLLDSTRFCSHFDWLTAPFCAVVNFFQFHPVDPSSRVGDFHFINICHLLYVFFFRLAFGGQEQTVGKYLPAGSQYGMK